MVKPSQRAWPLVAALVLCAPPADALGAIALRGVTANSSTAASPIVLSLPRPAGWTAGDLILVGLYADLSTATVAPVASGWTQLDTVDTGASSTGWWFYRFASASDPASYEFTCSTGPAGVAAVLVEYSGVDTTAPIYTHSAVQTTGSPFVAPAVTTVSGGTLVLLYVDDGAAGTPATWTAPSGFNAVWPNGTAAAFDMANLTGSPSGAASALCTANGGGAVDAIVLAPGATSGSGGGPDGGSTASTGTDGGGGGSGGSSGAPPDAGSAQGPHADAVGMGCVSAPGPMAGGAWIGMLAVALLARALLASRGASRR